MADIVLATLNARYIHAAFGLRYLLANLDELESRAVLLEFDIQQRPLEIVEALLNDRPKIIGLGVYVWNVREIERVVALLKKVRPEIVVVLGGPEVSHETEQQSLAALADYVVVGEGEMTFERLCRELLAGRSPPERILPGQVPDLAKIALPYRHYTAEDIAHRVVYVEASRGCPFTCEFCLSSLDAGVRAFDLDSLLDEFERLLDRGLRHFKFVDRTFNLNLRTSRALLQFFLDRLTSDLFLHFEMIPDRFPEELRQLVQRFPEGSLQFEIGIQTFNPEVADRIRRKQDYARTQEDLRFLREETGAHLHTDLIVGLPGESLDSFAAGFDRLLSFRPHEIQVGILKRLRGTPIGRHDREWAMVYSPEAPYEILQNCLMDFGTLQRLRRFSRAWDLTANSGNFTQTLPWLWTQPASSPFWSFLAWTDWLYTETGALHGIALNRLASLLLRYLTSVRGHPVAEITKTLQLDYARAGRGDLPRTVLEATGVGSAASFAECRSSRRRKRRQDRHKDR